MLRQSGNQASAFKKLAILADQQGDVEQSIVYFKHALERAREDGDKEIEKDCSVRLGIATGQAKMSDHFANILQRTVLGVKAGPSTFDGT